MVDLVSDGKWLLLCAQPLFDDILAILPELSRILDPKAVIKHILDLL